MPKNTRSKSKRTKKAKKPWFKRLWTQAGLGLVIFGLVIASISLLSLWWSQHSSAKPKPISQVLNNHAPKDDGTPRVTGNPVHLAISSVNIDLAVIPGYYYPSTQSWTLSLDKAQYAVMTAKPNNKSGDTFIYGHYRVHVFYTLPKIQPGALAVITTDNGHTFTYQFQSSTVTTPDNTSLFTYKGKPILILQTCTGVHFQNRQLFVFNLIEVT
jgi:LPXTG-site transpeptidase (sortase) family protein